MSFFLFPLFTTINEVFGPPLDMTTTECDHYGGMIELLGIQTTLLHLSWVTNYAKRHGRHSAETFLHDGTRNGAYNHCPSVGLFLILLLNCLHGLHDAKVRRPRFWRENLEGSCQADLELLRMLWCYDITASHGV